jgi:hypothetical protein
MRPPANLYLFHAPSHSRPFGSPEIAFDQNQRETDIIRMMALSNSELRAELGTTLRNLRDALSHLAQYFRSEVRDVWCWQAPKSAGAPTAKQVHDALSRDEALSHLAAGVQAIKYEDDQGPHESRIYPGIVAVGIEGIELVESVNRYKATLARVLRDMDGRTELGMIDPRTGERAPRALREIALEAFYYRRLQHWQATRRLEILRETPTIMGTLEYVGFMWATSREVRRTTREALIAEAKSNDRLLTEEDLEVLAQLPTDEPLALVRPGHTAPKANIRWVSRDGAAPTTKVRIAVLPLIMLGDQLPDRLRKLPPAPAPRQSRAARIDIEIEATPLLRTLPVYRYLKPIRLDKRRENTE